MSILNLFFWCFFTKRNDKTCAKRIVFSFVCEENIEKLTHVPTA